MRKFILLLCIFLVACESKKEPIENFDPIQKVQFYGIEDLDLNSIFENQKFKPYYLKDYSEDFFKNYFIHWRLDPQERAQQLKTSEVFKDFFSYEDYDPCVGGNYREFEEKLIQRLENNVAKSSYPNRLDYAIVTSDTDVRMLPTAEFCLSNVRNAGEGYPFDYFQNTSLWIGTPVMTLHQSEDQLWVFIKSPYGMGWVDRSHLAFVSKNQRETALKMDFAAILKENTVLKNNAGQSLCKTKIGTLFPIEQNGNASMRLLVPLRDPNGNLAWEASSITQDYAHKIPIEFSSTNANNLLSELLDTKYSWGGIDGGRDCSATIKDFLTPFGVWIPRNSGNQGNLGKVFLFEGEANEKKQEILNKGIPFLSVVYKRGHSMLYIGSDAENNPLIFHNVWGLKPKLKNDQLKSVATAREAHGIFGLSFDSENQEVSSRFIIGKTVITTVEPEKGFEDFEQFSFNSFLEQFQSINVVVE